MMNAVTACTVVGMVHIPLNTIVSTPGAWRDSLGIPPASADDWRAMAALPDVRGDGHDDCAAEGLARARALSFFAFLEERMLAEAAIYQQNGLGSLMLENVAGPYFVRGAQPPVIYWVMRALAERLRAAYAEHKIGLQILAYSDDWALEIACRCGLDFIRCESALFEGVRPEGRTPNAGNLAKLYQLRNRHMAQLGQTKPEPQVYVDVQKKHTVFMAELDALEVWLENILFQKLEGVIITGRATGMPVAETDLQQARAALEKAAAYSHKAVGRVWAPPLIVGSGVALDNIAMCKRYADAVIVGSSLKQNGYWECPLEEARVARFMNEWRNSKHEG
ncbi:MAG: hypothetical protein NTV22_14355 [bacterium]|nr:hypothetical protein [bacterium]